MNQTLQSFLKFSFVGLMNTGMDIVIFTVFVSLGIQVLPAQLISYSCGIVNSYFLNKFWTFHQNESPSIKQPIKFIAVNMLTLGVVTLLLNGFYNHLGLPLLGSKILATSIGVLINYGGSRFWVFRLSATGLEKK